MCVCVCVCEVCVCVCVCVRACARARAHIFRTVTLEPSCTLCVSFFLLFFLHTFFIADNIMCVILCLFSAFSRKVGALQISIIIINVPKT